MDDQTGSWPQDVVVIHNPEAGDGSQPPSLLRRVLEDAGYTARYVSTDADWRAALRAPVDLVVLAGGDGTVARGVRLLGGREIPVALLPTGTANNLAKTMGVAGDAREVVRSWRDGLVVPLDIWVAQTPSSREPFVEAIGGGLIASVIARGRELEAPTFILGSEFDRALHLLRDAAEEESAEAWSVTIDGVDHAGEYIGVEVMNGPYVGPNIPLAPDAGPGDAGLDVVLIGDRDRAALVERFRNLPDAQSPAPGMLRIVHGRHVRVVPPPGVALHLDGDPWQPDFPHERWVEVVPAGVVQVLIGRS